MAGLADLTSLRSPQLPHTDVTAGEAGRAIDGSLLTSLTSLTKLDLHFDPYREYYNPAEDDGPCDPEISDFFGDVLWQANREDVGNLDVGMQLERVLQHCEHVLTPDYVVRYTAHVKAHGVGGSGLQRVLVIASKQYRKLVCIDLCCESGFEAAVRLQHRQDLQHERVSYLVGKPHYAM